VEMKDDGLNGDGAAGDGIYGALISNHLSTIGQMIRYYIIATDTQNNPPASRPSLTRRSLHSTGARWCTIRR